MIWKFLGVSGDEDFNISAQGWFKITVVAAAIGFLFFVLSGLAVLSQPDPDTKQKTSQAFAPFLVGIVATVTFCAAIWRGKLNSEQIKQQKRQNDAKDEENLAKLMMDGAKMLGEEKDSHVLAGIAALQAVVATPNTKFATHSMDLLADYTSENIAKDETFRTVNSARIALNVGAESGYVSNRRIEVKAALPDDLHEIFNGFTRAKYVGGWITNDVYRQLKNLRNFEFDAVKFDDCTFSETLRGTRGCEFNECKFVTIGLGHIKGNSFDRSDFSGAKFTKLGRTSPLSKAQEKELAKLKQSGCFFDENNPPTGLGISDWSLYLNVVANQ